MEWRNNAVKAGGGVDCTGSAAAEAGGDLAPELCERDDLAEDDALDDGWADWPSDEEEGAHEQCDWDHDLEDEPAWEEDADGLGDDDGGAWDGDLDDHRDDDI